MVLTTIPLMWKNYGLTDKTNKEDCVTDFQRCFRLILQKS